MKPALRSYFRDRLRRFQQNVDIHRAAAFVFDPSETFIALAVSDDRPVLASLNALYECRESESNVFREGNVASRLFADAESEGELPKSLGVFPVVFGLAFFGVLTMEAKRKDFFSASTIAEAEALAAQLGALWHPRDVSNAISLDKAMDALKFVSSSFSWCGVYRREGSTLCLAAFRGAPTPHPIIVLPKGICGAAVSENRTLNIEDVSKDPRYLVCDHQTRSELVVPIRNAAGQAIGQIDINSPQLSAFSPALVLRVEELARALSPLMINSEKV